MIDYENFRLVHLHGNERVPMTERAAHDAADLDPERSWTSGARIFRCNACDESIAVLPVDPDRESEKA